METLPHGEYRREKQQQERNEDRGRVTLGGIVSASGGNHCFKVKGDNDVLQKIKSDLAAHLKEQGYQVSLEHGYCDE
jgi:hypothetical protein